MKLEPCRWDISACELQFLLSQSLCFWLSFHCCEQLSKKIIPNIFYGGFVFIFSPCFQKIPVFFFFCKQPGTAHCWWSETISPLKKNSWWNYKKKKNLQKGSRRLCLIMDCSTGERILIYIFKKLRSEKNTPDGTIDIVWRRLLFQKCVDQFSYLGPRLQISFYSETIR